VTVGILLNLDKLQNTLGKRLRDAQREGKVSVVVGYTQGYALFVHENLTAHHPVGQAKFLEEPARQTSGAIAREALEKGQRMERALLLEGLNLQRRSQKLVPVDTGALRASAFTEVEK